MKKGALVSFVLLVVFAIFVLGYYVLSRNPWGRWGNMFGGKDGPSHKNIVSPFQKTRDKTEDDVQKKIGNAEVQYDEVFQGKVYLDEIKLLSLDAPESCGAAFKEQGTIEPGCSVDYILVLRRVNGEMFPSGLFPTQTNDRFVIPVGCRVGESIVRDVYSEEDGLISNEDMIALLKARNKEDALVVRIVRKSSDALLAPDNLRCAVPRTQVNVVDDDVVQE